MQSLQKRSPRMSLFAEKDGQTELVLNHTNLPDDEGGRGHEKGWTYFLGRITEVVSK